jgi:hypothetical protein
MNGPELKETKYLAPTSNELALYVRQGEAAVAYFFVLFLWTSQFLPSLTESLKNRPINVLDASVAKGEVMQARLCADQLLSY